MVFAVSASFTERGIMARKQQRLAQQIAAPDILRIADARQAEAREARMMAMFHEAHTLIDIEAVTPPGQRIMREIAEEHGFSPAQIRGPRRDRSLIRARHHAIYEVARRCPDLSLNQIGGIFRRDHTSILWAIREWPSKAALAGIAVEPIRGAGNE